MRPTPARPRAGCPEPSTTIRLHKPLEQGGTIKKVDAGVAGGLRVDLGDHEPVPAAFPMTTNTQIVQRADAHSPADRIGGDGESSDRVKEVAIRRDILGSAIMGPSVGRLPSNPARLGAKPPKAAEPARAEGVLTVSRLAEMISTVVGDHLPARVRVVGEVGGARGSTRLYFGLQGRRGADRAAVFASNLRKLGFEPRDGQQIVATGRVEFYEPQGRVTLIVEAIEPGWTGAHELRFKQLCEELRRLGWFAATQTPAPDLPRKVAVVTSRTGEALQDVLDTMARRCPAVGVVLVPVKVQGEAEAEQVVRTTWPTSPPTTRSST